VVAHSSRENEDATDSPGTAGKPGGGFFLRELKTNNGGGECCSRIRAGRV